ncbi:MAG: GAF domain-containing protein [Leptolyngbyaceae bacterium]|nr:GAF domain-containing protein [Leptolyngbyaceae bacterium]
MAPPKELTVHEKQLVTLGRLLQAIREGENADMLVEITLKYLQEEFDYSVVWIGLYERLEHRLLGKGGSIPGDAGFLKQRFVMAPGDILEQVVIQQRPVAVPDLREETRAGDWRKAAKKFNIQGTILFPIRHRDQCYGVMLLGSSLWGATPRADDKARLSTVVGELATAIHYLEVNVQRQQVKRPDQPLLSLLDKLRTLPSLSERLEAVVEETHQFIEPSRTNIYWFERERRYFWRRTTNRQVKKSKGNTEILGQSPGITVQEVGKFYEALAADQLVAIGEAHSSLKGDITSRLMQQIQARSLLAAPILFQNELLGFLAVEGNEARIWQDQEKTYVRGAAQLVALTAPLEAMEETVKQTKLDQTLTAELTRAISSEEDWKETLHTCAEQLCKRLRAERILLLLYDPDQDEFEICHQSQPKNRRPIASPLLTLSEIDWQMLQRVREPISIENLDEDLKLMAWRNPLLEQDVKSLLVCKTSNGQQVEGLLIVCHEASRAWSRSEQEIVQVVSQQLGLILHQWQLQKQTDQQQKIYQTTQWAITTIQQTNQLERLESLTLQHIAQILQAPMVTMVTWQTGRQKGRVSFPVLSDKSFSVNTEAVIPIYTDTFIQSVLQADGLLPLSVDVLPAETRQWLSGTNIGQILAMALRTSPEHEPTGIVIVADHIGRHWPDRHLNALGNLVSQLAWSRRHLVLTEKSKAYQEKLERLNWYKQRRIEEMYRTLNLILRRLDEMAAQKDALNGMRYQQVVRQLGDSLNSITQVLRDEQWRLRAYQESAPLAGLLKRGMERIDGLVKQRQLWSQVHNNEGNLTLSGDIVKMELVLHEVLVTACYRCQPGGRVDIWCRTIDPRSLELSITDSGVIEPRLIAELQAGRVVDLLAPSTFDQPPGLHMFICQSLLQQMGGELNLYQLEDGRVLTRLVLPIAPGIPTSQPSTNQPKTTTFFQ